MNKIRKTPALTVLLNCPIVSLEEFVAVDDDNVYPATIMAELLLDFVETSKNIIDADSDDENEMHNAVPVPKPSEMRNIMKNMRSYLGTDSNDEMNDKMEQFVDNLMLKKTIDEAHFWLNGYVNKQNCCVWSEANPEVYVETPLHPEKLTVRCALWAGGILLQKR
ncbi:hypothetical protein TNCV_3025161 [Trichonephila clavipes]|nr:hypothetical protein TNCV_3025161 [Trichonephila clavipes]